MIEIRTLGLADYDAICEVWKASGVKYQLTGRESYENFSRQMKTGLQTVLGAMVDGKLAGVVVATHDGRKGWINRLGVAPEFQRQGVATALIRAAEEMFHAQGLLIVAAFVEHENNASLALFQHEGFHVHDDVYYLTKRDHPNA
jgi:ribosomal protein S18 acetylase RimI-like enzyme